MKKSIAIAILMALTVSCQKSNNSTDAGQSTTNNFVFNNIKVDASVVRGWLANTNLERIVLTFHSADLRSFGSNLTLSAFAYEKSSETPIADGIELNIASPASLPLEANVIFSNNVIRIGAIRRAVSDASGMLDYDYLLLQPRYYRSNGKAYLVYSMQAIKNGQPIKMNVEDECDVSNPSPPAPPPEDCDEP